MKVVSALLETLNLFLEGYGPNTLRVLAGNDLRDVLIRQHAPHRRVHVAKGGDERLM